MLLGRPWIHENKVVPSTLHQCFKYARDGQVRMVVADTKPFTTAQAHFADAKFYLEGTVTKEQSKKEKGTSSPTKEVKKITSGLENLTLPLTSLEESQASTSLLKGFTRPSEGPAVEHADLPSQRANGFDPNAYKLLVKAGYERKEVTKLADESDESSDNKSAKSAKTNKVWLKKSDRVETSKSGLGFSPLKLKIHTKAVRHITDKEVEEGEEVQSKPVRLSAFDRLSALPSRISVFDRLTTQTDRVSVFDRMKVEHAKGQRTSAFERLKDERIESFPTKAIHPKARGKIFKGSAQKKKKTSHVADESKDFRSTIPSRMKRQSKWVVTTGETLKAKTNTIVMTKPSEEMEICTSNHVSAEEVNEKSQEDAQEASNI